MCTEQCPVPNLGYYSDVLHPNRANVKKDELRSKLSELYKASKDQVSVFGFRTQFGGGKSTGFALIYDSVEALKKFEPHYRLVRIGQATKIEKASRQQRTSWQIQDHFFEQRRRANICVSLCRQTAQEQVEDVAWNSEGQRREEVEERQVKDYGLCWVVWGCGRNMWVASCIYKWQQVNSMSRRRRRDACIVAYWLILFRIQKQTLEIKTSFF